MIRQLLCTVTLAVTIVSLAAPPSRAGTFPGVNWQQRTPGEVGLDASKLAELASLVGGTGMIVRDGYQVYTWGNVASRGDWASASKPVLSTLLLAGDADGRCSLDDAVGDYLPGGSAKDSSITFFQLANMMSGYSRGEGAGDAWAYNDHAINLYGKVLFEHVYGGTPSSVFNTELGFLQFEGAVSVSNSQYGRIIGMSVRDFARIGLFWANRGFWDGTQLIPAAQFDLITNHVPSGLPLTTSDGAESWNLGSFGGTDNQTQVGPGHYGMNFWVNTNGFFGAGEPEIFQANGHWGREICTVFPERNLIAVGRGTWGHPSTQAIQLLLEADTRTAVTPTSWAQVKGWYRRD